MKRIFSITLAMLLSMTAMVKANAVKTAENVLEIIRGEI